MSFQPPASLQFGNKVDPASKRVRYRIRRAPSQGAVIFTNLSHQLTTHPVHFWQNRTIPCLVKNCEACAAGREARDKAWLIGLDEKTREEFIWEMTPGPADKLSQAWSELRTLRGYRLRFMRIGSRPNGKLVVQVGDRVEAPERLPEAPDLRPILMQIWGFKLEPGERSEPRQPVVVIRSSNGDLPGQLPLL